MNCIKTLPVKGESRKKYFNITSSNTGSKRRNVKIPEGKKSLRNSHHTGIVNAQMSMLESGRNPE